MFISGMFWPCCPCVSHSGRAALALGSCCRELAGMPGCPRELSGPPGAMSAASLPLKFSWTCRQPPRNPLSFCHVLAAMLSVCPRPWGGKQCVIRIMGWEAKYPIRIVGWEAEYPIRIAAVSVEGLLQVLPLSHPSLSISTLPLECPGWAEPRAGAAGCFPLPHSTHSTPENLAIFFSYSPAVGRHRISNIHLPWREGTAVGF